MAISKAKKQKMLDLVAEEIENCRQCKINKIGKAVPGEGNPDADIMFIGEAPGKKESEVGRPFIGRAGKMLRDGLASIGLQDQEVYITSPVKRLPKHVTPTPKEVIHGKTHLLKQFEIINPRIIVLLGRVGALAMLDKDIQVMREHGKILPAADGRTYFIMMHPAAPLYSPQLRQDFFKDFKKLKRLLQRVAKGS